MYGITFGDTHTYDSWGLFLIDFTMELPPAKTKYVDLPIGNGSVDMTEAIFGDVSYGERTAAFQFAVKLPFSDRIALQNTIAAYLHGRRMRIVLPDDPYHYYMGRVQLTSGMIREGTVDNLAMEAICEPYKYKMFPTVVSGAVPAGGTVTRSCLNSRMRVIPEITVSAAATIIFGGSTYSVNAGTWKLTNVVFVEGDNEITITAAAGTTYSITYQEGLI